MSNGVGNDYPIYSTKHDQFDRLPFSKHVAKILAMRNDPNSLVISINGSWGSGKTTVMNFIRSELEESFTECVICMDFNPWIFPDEGNLLCSFFKMLELCIGKSTTTKKEQIGKIIKDYGGLVLSFVHPALENVAQTIGEGLTTVDLDRLKNEFEELLIEENKRLIVFMDDIDRLDKSEIQSLFKLIKLIADFKNTSYVLAFDEDMVAEALSEKYASHNPEAGKKFLEKIVQLPLHLPVVEQGIMCRYCWQGVDDALRIADIEISDNEAKTYTTYFMRTLASRLTTPRQAKRYQNGLVFMLPLLKGEVNTVDMLLLEGIRTFYPGMYNHIRQNPKLFIDTYSFREGNSDSISELKESLNEGYTGLMPGEINNINELLQYLFPALERIFRNVHYGSKWAENWCKEKRLCSGDYFYRYFYYTVPSNDISDATIKDLFILAKTRTEEEVELFIIDLISRDRAENFSFKLNQNINLLTTDSAKNMTLALCKLGDLFPNPEAIFSFYTPFSRVASFIADAIISVSCEDRLVLAYQVVQASQPLAFGAEIIRWLRPGEESLQAFSKEEQEGLFKELADRVASLSGEMNILMDSKNGSSMLWIWREYRSSEEVESYLNKALKEDPNQAILLLKCFIGTAWGMSDGIPRMSDLERRQYDNITLFIKPEVVVEALTQIYDLSHPRRMDRTISPEERIANDFMYIYQQINKAVI